MNGLTILHLLPWLDYGGVEKYVIGLSAALRERGHDCIIVSSGGKLLPEAEAAGIRHISMDIHGRHGFPAIRKLARLIDREQVDVLNAHNWTAGSVGFLAARLARVPFFLTVHGVREPLQRFFTYYWGPKVITVSAVSRDHLISAFHLPPSRVVTSFIGVDTDRFSPRPPSASVIRELGLDPSARRILHVSRFSRGKAEVALRLIEGMPELGERVPGLQLIVVGVGPLEDEVRKRADEVSQRLGRRAVVFAGGRSDIPECVSVADVVVGTATVALEAMAGGKPVVAAGKVGFAGLVGPGNFDAANATCFGDHGATEPVTTSNLVEAITPVLEDAETARVLGDFGRQTVLGSFSMRRAAEDVEGIYRGVLSGIQPVRRIAVFHLNQVGDLLFSLPALAALRARFPKAHVTSVLRPNLVDLMQANPLVDDIIVHENGLAGKMRIARSLRQCGFDLVVAFSQSASTVLEALACGATDRIGFVDSDLGFLLTRKVHVRGLPWPGKLGRLAVCVGADRPADSYVGMLRIPEEMRVRAAHLLERHGVDAGARIAAIAPAASGRQRHKAWVADRFAAVADHLHRCWGATIVIVGGPGEAAEAERVAGAMSAPSINLAGATTTGELAAILERAVILVGLDSGPMHVAAAMDTPVVALFGPTDPSRTAPRGEGHEVVAAGLACAPCERPCEARECMTAITVELVTSAVDRILGRTAED